MQSEQHPPLSREAPLKLRELRHVILLAEELHFARAAERAFLSQSAFSRSIAAVEEDLGLRLFDRGPRFVRPTPAGERVILRARRLLSSAQDLAHEATQLRTGELGDIAIGAGPFSSLTVVTPALTAMRQRHPEVCIRLEVIDTASLLQHLHDERVALFVSDIREVAANDQWHVEALGDTVGAVYCRATHPLAQDNELSLADLKNQFFASPHLPQPLMRRLREVFTSAMGEAPRLALECESVAVLREFALNTDTLLIAPHDVVRGDIEAGRLRQLHVREFGPLGLETPVRSALGMVWLRDRTPSTSTRILIGLLREEARRSLLPNMAVAEGQPAVRG